MSQIAVFDVVQNSDPFQNPVTGPISGASGATGAAAGVAQDQLNTVNAELVFDPGNPVLLQQKADLEGLLDRFNVLSTGDEDLSLPPFYSLVPGAGLGFAAMLAHTNYFSGVDSTPPLGFDTAKVS